MLVCDCIEYQQFDTQKDFTERYDTYEPRSKIDIPKNGRCVRVRYFIDVGYETSVYVFPSQPETNREMGEREKTCK